MLILTHKNIQDILSLGDALRGNTGGCTCNPLAQVGAGTALRLPAKQDLVEFLQANLQAAKVNSAFAFKENLFYVFRKRQKRPLLPGCTGKGCGASGNFVAPLPYGEVHAFGKDPSHLGNTQKVIFDDINHSVDTGSYPRRMDTCSACSRRKNCDVCPAVSIGGGIEPWKGRDPFCFLKEESS